MPHRVLAAALLLATLAAPARGQSAADKRKVDAATQARALPVKTITYESKSVGRTLKYNIILPAAYEESDRKFPVLYLLHGYSGNYTGWARMGVPKYASAYDMIVVMPDGGNSWYVNWAKGEGDQKNAWEDALTKDLIGHVDGHYRTVAAREGRAINGLSMGGYGALNVGLRNPDLFCTVGSHSGAISFARKIAGRIREKQDLAKAAAKRSLSDEPNTAIGLEDFDSQVERTPKGKMFANAEQADENDPFALAPKLSKGKAPHIFVDCGTEDGLLKDGQEFAKLLIENSLPFTYGESAGGHTGSYWTREVGVSMAVQYQILRREIAKAEAKSEASKAEKSKGEKSGGS